MEGSEDSERKKRRLEDDENEEEKVEQFFSLIRFTRQVHDRMTNELQEAKEKQKMKAIEDKQIPTWIPSFQPEDFMEDPHPITCPEPSEGPSVSKGKNKEKEDEKHVEKEEEKKGSEIDLKLSL